MVFSYTSIRSGRANKEKWHVSKDFAGSYQRILFFTCSYSLKFTLNPFKII